jgi:hypothetical protein
MSPCLRHATVSWSMPQVPLLSSCGSCGWLGLCASFTLLLRGPSGQRRCSKSAHCTSLASKVRGREEPGGVPHEPSMAWPVTCTRVHAFIGVCGYGVGMFIVCSMADEDGVPRIKDPRFLRKRKYEEQVTLRLVPVELASNISCCIFYLPDCCHACVETICSGRE